MNDPKTVLQNLLVIYAGAAINFDKAKNRDIVTPGSIEFAKKELVKASAAIISFFEKSIEGTALAAVEEYKKSLTTTTNE